MNATTKAERIPVTTGAALGPVRRRRPDPEFMPVSAQAPESLMKRLVGMMAEAGTADRGTQIGLMRLRGELGEPGQADALYGVCIWFCDLHARYMRAIEAKEVKSGSAELIGKSEPPDPFSEVGSRVATRERRIVTEYESARLTAMTAGGVKFVAFCSVVVFDVAPSSVDKASVRQIAEILRAHRAQSSRFRRGRRA